MNKRTGFWQAVRDFWKKGKSGVAVFFISVFVFFYSVIEWNEHKFTRDIIEPISLFIPVAIAYTGMLIGGVDIMVFLSDWYADRQEKRVEERVEERVEKAVQRAVQEAVQAAVATAKEESYAEGYKDGVKAGVKKRKKRDR